jgi:predicted RNA-binding protein associated with RNAse of E/G family
MIEIHYRRPPDREQVFRQIVVAETDAYVVTLLESAELARPVTAGGRTVLEPGAPVVWITYRGQWHDVGRFHLADGTFTGVYANVLTPVEMDGERWETTDLFLDLWSGADGTLVVLDEDELREAEREGWVGPETASRAREEAAALLEAARRGGWPGPEVHAWTLERAREAVSRGAAGDTDRQVTR